MENKELKELKVRDVLMMDEFRVQISQVMEAEVFNQSKAEKEARAKGCRINRTPLDRLCARKVWEPETMIEYFGSVLNKSLIGFSAAERDYIYLVGMAAFKRTMQKLQEAEKDAAASCS